MERPEPDLEIRGGCLIKQIVVTHFDATSEQVECVTIDNHSWLSPDRL